MSNDSASGLTEARRLSEACGRVRAAGTASGRDLLGAVAEEARRFSRARHAWVAHVQNGAIASVETLHDESADPESADDLASPPMPSLLAAAQAGQTVARAPGFVSMALSASSGAPEALLVLPRPSATSSGADDETALDLGLSQLALVAALVLETARMRARVDSVARARELLMASVSHDLRNPLNTFAMSAGLLRDDLERNDVDPTRGISLVSRMERATSRMQALIEDLVEASRIDARKIDYVIRAESAAQLVRDAVTAATPVASEKGASVALDTVDESARVMADRARTMQLLAKVVAFEAKSTGDGGAIRISVAKDGDTVLFTARAFGPGGMALTAPEEGRGGLSLLIARGLAEAQQGAFRIEPGEGLAVSFTLPAAKS